MKSAAWHARVEASGKVLGAGFLVTPDTVVTCAHVLDGRVEGLAVSFTERPGTDPVPVRLLAHGGWSARAGHDRGDVAVLRLERDAGVAPAVLAPPDAVHGRAVDGGPRKLVVYGFPAGFDEGTLAEYRVTSRQLISDEWNQLESWQQGGQPLAPGFSGAAVALADTGEVVGMVTAAAGARGVSNGRMMPAEVMRRYWRDLDGLIPVPGHRPADRARLYRLVERAESAGLGGHWTQLYNAVRDPLDPRPPEGGFSSLRSAALFVLSELEGEEAVGTVIRFAERLEALLSASGAFAAPGTQLASPNAPFPTSGPHPTTIQAPFIQSDTQLPQPSPPFTPVGAPPEWTPILVDLHHSGAGDDRVRVEVSAYSGGRRHPIGSDTVPKDGLAEYVQRQIEAAFPFLTPGADELIAFALPRNWLDLPVDRWPSGPDDETPLGCSFPLVVTDHARRKNSTRHVLTRAWKRLDSVPGARVHRVECGDAEEPVKLRMRLRRPDACLAGFSTAPAAQRTRAHFDVTLVAPAPIVVWSREGCDSGPQEECAGGAGCAGKTFLDQLDSRVSGVPPAELPRHIMELREEAAAEEEHWARGIQLLWDDPRLFPDLPAAHSHSPVA
ncbi:MULTISPECIES: trypsin-like peptidase domain-containing protein [unclassified Streptomyces]|uniref:VMAP-C domain-containing protein n=1 Tax=unclassified Streptomyces TaxID=2593676 RepID=UPI000DD98FDE|nr:MULTISPECIES: trypsin-like peptidase domain-containing protein [unclassified Streptomyces]QZZ27645.1 trypsin-like peptidase domain-containing protein [Streptomyces sp. ST1015]